MADFRRAIERVRSKHAQFLMVGRRWDMDVTQPIDFSSPSWGNRIHEEAIRANHQRDGFWIDYFVFSRGLYSADVPAFAIGRTAWDNWLVWKACVSGHPVVDVSQDVIAIHQNHDYNHHPQGSEGIWRGQEAKRNLVLAGGPDHWGGMDDATLVLKSGRLGRNYRRHRRQFEKRWQPIWSGIQEFTVYKLWLPAWHRFLDATRPARTVLGLRSKAMRARQSHQ